MLLEALFLLPLPHGNQLSEAVIIELCHLKGIQRFHYHLPDTRVARRTEEIFDGIGKLLVHVPSEGWARVVGQDANQHNSVVLPRGLGHVIL